MTPTEIQEFIQYLNDKGVRVNSYSLQPNGTVSFTVVPIATRPMK